VGPSGLPRKPLLILLGIDELMDMGRTLVTVLGNCLAIILVSRWEGDFAKEQLSPVVMGALAG
jgi:proton glutamate symport protein